MSTYDAGIFLYDFHRSSYRVFMSIFEKAKNLYSIQKQSKAIKQQLKNTHIEAEHNGVTITITAEFEVISIVISDEAWGRFSASPTGRAELETCLKKAFEKATKKAQEIAGVKMKGIWKEMGVG